MDWRSRGLLVSSSCLRYRFSWAGLVCLEPKRLQVMHCLASPSDPVALALSIGGVDFCHDKYKSPTPAALSPRQKPCILVFPPLLSSTPTLLDPAHRSSGRLFIYQRVVPSSRFLLVFSFSPLPLPFSHSLAESVHLGNSKLPSAEPTSSSPSHLQSTAQQPAPPTIATPRYRTLPRQNGC